MSDQGCEQVFKCQLCGKTFKDFFDFTEHELNPHPSTDTASSSSVQEEQDEGSDSSDLHVPQTLGTFIFHEISFSAKTTIPDDDCLSQESLIRVVSELEPPAKKQRTGPFPDGRNGTRLGGPILYEDYCFVFFDLETGDLKPEFSDILEIAARTEDDQFSTYVRPTKAISSAATRINKLDFKNGKLRHREKEVSSIPVKNALSALIHWLKSIQLKTGLEIVLVAHNVEFDAIFLFFYLTQEGLDAQFRDVVVGFIDTLSIFRKVYGGVKSHSLAYLVKRYLRDGDLKHSAKSDVQQLEKLFLTCIKNRVDDYSNHSYTFHHFWKSIKRTFSFKDLIDQNILSWSMVAKLNEAGYGFGEFKNVFDSTGEEGIKAVLQESDERGLPRVTGNMSILRRLVEYFDTLQFDQEL